MARSRSRSKRGSKPAKSRRSKKTEEVVEEVEVVEEGRRLGIDDGMVIITFLLIDALTCLKLVMVIPKVLVLDDLVPLIITVLNDS